CIENIYHLKFVKSGQTLYTIGIEIYSYILLWRCKMQHTAWKDFNTGVWDKAVDVRDFIQRNYIPYEGDDSFLAGPT
ncbi:Formate acetyltransferase, partial [human gut metagenome]